MSAILLYLHPAALIETELLCEIGSDILDMNPQIAANDLAMLHDLIHNVVGHVDRNCEADAMVAATFS